MKIVKSIKKKRASVFSCILQQNAIFSKILTSGVFRCNCPLPDTRLATPSSLTTPLPPPPITQRSEHSTTSSAATATARKVAKKQQHSTGTPIATSSRGKRTPVQKQQAPTINARSVPSRPAAARRGVPSTSSTPGGV